VEAVEQIPTTEFKVKVHGSIFDLAEFHPIG
jgi:hypothetical protein